jgi:hypothetical protein
MWNCCLFKFARMLKYCWRTALDSASYLWTIYDEITSSGEWRVLARTS